MSGFYRSGCFTMKDLMSGVCPVYLGPCTRHEEGTVPPVVEWPRSLTLLSVWYRSIKRRQIHTNVCVCVTSAPRICCFRASVGTQLM